MSRRPGVRAACGLVLVASLSRQAWSQIVCNNGNSSVSRLACHDAGVRRLMREVKAVSTRRHCSPEQAYEFRTVRRAWGGDQFSCYAAPDAKACIIPKLLAEVYYFKGVAGCDIQSHPLRFKGSVPSYILAHPKTYADGPINVVGEIALDSCDPTSSSVTGRIKELNSPRRALAVRFKSMPEGERQFLCEKQPFSSWSGTLQFASDGAPFLYATDVLGVPLP